MAKLINVADDVYQHLAELKGKESFSVIIRHLITQKTNKENVLHFCGKKGVNAEAVKQLAPLWKKWSDVYA